MSDIDLKITPSGLAVRVPWNQAWLDEFKAQVNYRDRAWDQTSKRWYVNFSAARIISDLTEKHFGVKVELPDLTGLRAEVEELAIRLLYITVCKKRDDGQVTAFGQYNGGWNVVFPEAVLKSYFNAVESEDTTTLYGVLALPRTATVQEIKSGFRRLARQWHPDVCREEGAAEKFQELDSAYKTLSDPLKKKRYDAGLAFEASLKTPADQSYSRFLANPALGYRPPLRCGDLTVEATRELNRLFISRIIKWDDITDAAGRVLVTSWDIHDQKVKTVWV
jgi:hypothetical protein